MSSTTSRDDTRLGVWTAGQNRTETRRATYKVAQLHRGVRADCAGECVQRGERVREGEADEDELVVEREAEVEEKVQQQPERLRLDEPAPPAGAPRVHRRVHRRVCGGGGRGRQTQLVRRCDKLHAGRAVRRAGRCLRVLAPRVRERGKTSLGRGRGVRVWVVVRHGFGGGWEGKQVFAGRHEDEEEQVNE